MITSKNIFEGMVANWRYPKPNPPVSINVDPHSTGRLGGPFFDHPRKMMIVMMMMMMAMAIARPYGRTPYTFMRYAHCITPKPQFAAHRLVEY